MTMRVVRGTLASRVFAVILIAAVALLATLSSAAGRTNNCTKARLIAACRVGLEIFAPIRSVT